MDFKALYRAVFRHDSSEPGYALLPCPEGVALSDALSELVMELERVQERSFVRVHQLTFDQQVTTRFHRDGGPDRSYLFLGYAPTRVPSVIRIADHVRAAEAQGMTPEQFLERHPPLTSGFETALAPFIVPLHAFDHRVAQLLLINNSLANGVLHQATIPVPDTSQRREIVSWMLTMDDASLGREA